MISAIRLTGMFSHGESAKNSRAESGKAVAQECGEEEGRVYVVGAIPDPKKK
jgi:hypothetical protein